MKRPETTIEVNLARVQKVQDYIHKHFGEDLTLTVLAAQVNIVPTTLCHVFKQVTGQRVSDYLIQTRINQAARLLRETSMEVKAITYACGFSTQTNFNRHFKRLMGCTPTAYRFQKKNYNQ
jgi:AraC-like DNA-binding protein